MIDLRKLTKTLAGLTLGVCLAAAPLAAQDEKTDEADSGKTVTQGSPTQGSLTAFTLPEINLYGVAEQTPAVPVTTRFGTQFNAVTEEQIKQQNALDFLDALRNVPGVTYQKRNIVGGKTSHSLYMRGRGASHPSSDLYVNFDDAPRSGVLYGQTLADGIPVYALGGMEVYKYPQPSRFGSGYGMVNFVPKYMVEEGHEFRTGFQGGSYGTFAENLGFGLKGGAFDVYAAQSWISSDGHEEHSRAQQASYYLNLGFQVNEHWGLRLLNNYVDSQTLSPWYADGGRRGDNADRYDTQTAFTTFTLSNQFDQASGYVKFYYNDTDFSLVDESGIKNNISTQAIELFGLRARENFSLWEGGEIVAGFDLDKTQLTNTNNRTHQVPFHRVWEFPDQTLFSPYLAVSQYFGSEDEFHVLPSAGLRYYRHDVFADKSSPQAGLVLGYGPTDLHFNYAKGVNYPSPVVLQGFLNTSGVSTPLPPGFNTEDIKPEVVDHYEIGLTHTWPERATLGATLFYDDGKDRTRVYMGGPVPPSNSFNYTVGRYEVSGLELTGSVTPIEDLDLFAGATWLKARATGEDRTETDKMPYTPDITLQAGLNYKFLENFRLNLDYQHLQGIYSGTSMRTGGNFTPLTDADKLDDVNVVNLRLGYQLDYLPWRVSEAEVFLAVNNLFNADYAYALDGNRKPYEMPGITFMAGFDLKFK